MENFLPKSMSKELIAKLKLDTKNLVCVGAQISLHETHQASLRDLQLMKCRLIVCSYPELLACPDPKFLDEIIIVFAPENLVNKGSLNEYLQEFALKPKNYKKILTVDILIAAVQYVLAAKLAPQWNALNDNGKNIFLQGINFVDSSPVDAANLRIFNKGYEIWIGIRVFQVRLPIVRLEYLNIRSYYMDKLREAPGPCIHDTKIGEPWVYTLPSLRRGKITLLSSGLPLESDFQNYRQVRRYWKETHGIVVPREESTGPALLASVKFEDSGRPHIYPLLCLLRSPPEYSPSENTSRLAYNFFSAITSIVGAEISPKRLKDVPKQKKEKRVREEREHEEVESNASSNRTSISIGSFSTASLDVSAELKQAHRHRPSLSLPKPLPRGSSKGELKTTDNAKLPAAVSKSPKRSLQKESNFRESKTSSSATTAKRKPARKSTGPKVKRGSSLYVPIETRFKQNTLDMARADDLKSWLQEKKVSLKNVRGKGALLRLVRTELGKADN